MVVPEESKILNDLSEAVIKGDEEAAKRGAEEALKCGVDPVKAIDDGVVKGMNVIGTKFHNFEIFLPEVMLAADAVKAAIEMLKPSIEAAKAKAARLVVIGTNYGDIHDIGKNLVSVFLTVAGFEVHDLGADVNPKTFIDVAVQKNADIIATSSLLTSSAMYSRDIVQGLKSRGLRDKFYVLVGGGPTDPGLAEEVEADGWGKFAQDGVEVAKVLIEKGRDMKRPVIKG